MSDKEAWDEWNDMSDAARMLSWFNLRTSFDAKERECERLRELLLEARQSVNAELCVIEPMYAPRAVELRQRLARIDAALKEPT